MLFKLLFSLLVWVTLSACGGGGGGGGGNNSSPEESQAAVEDASIISLLEGSFPTVDTPSNNQTLASCSATTAVDSSSTITGRVYYQRVPLSIFGLNYSAISQLPVRGAVVEAIDASSGQCSETVLATTLSNGNGEYGLDVPLNQAVCIQVRAQLYREDRDGGASWDIQVTDNTSGNAPYYLLDNRQATPTDLPVRDLLAGAGVETGSSDYTQPRAAASFAILDSLCEAVDTVIAADTDIDLPLLSIRWSELNNSAELIDESSIEAGDIGGSFYRQQFFLRGNEVIGSSHEIFLLGDEDSNTDEYDSHVITHEFGHYLTGSFSRYDALGGEHAIGDRLDFRLAFEEGWADAFSGMALSDAVPAVAEDPANYRNSLGVNQSRTSRFTLDNRNQTAAGWYSEGSVASILFNLFDSNNDSVDELSLGFTPIFDVLSGTAYRTTESLTSIYTFINQLKQQTTDDAAIDRLVADQDTETVIDDFGSDEDISNNDIVGDQDAQAVYTELPLNTTIEVCSNNRYGNRNKLSVNQFLILDATTNKNYRFQIQPNSGADANGRAVAIVYKQGEQITSQRAASAGSTLTFSTRLQGRHIMTLAHADYLDDEDNVTGRRCFSVFVE